MPMDTTAQRSSNRVSLKVVRPVLTPIRNTSIDSNAEIRIAEPEAAIRSNLNTAGMAVWLATIGATLNTSWSRCGMAKFMVHACIAPPAANIALNGLSVQMVTMTVRIRKGDHALKIWPKVYSDLTDVRGRPKPPALATTGPVGVAPAICAPAVRLGCQTLRNRVRAIRLSSAEVMSGSSGPMKFEVRNWLAAKVKPATRAAGQVSLTPRMPSIMNTSQNGTNSDSNGN